MSEESAQLAVQAALLNSGVFQAFSITVNDFTVLDRSASLGPFAVIQTADTVEMLPLATGSFVYDVFLTLYQPFRDWRPSLMEFQVLRDAAMVAVRGVDAVIMTLRTATPIEYQYNNYVDSAESKEAMPLFIRQTLVARIHNT